MQAIDMHIHVPREPGLPEIEIEAELLRYCPRPSATPRIPRRWLRSSASWTCSASSSRWIPPPTPARNPTATTGVASIVNDHPEQFMGFASVDPWMGKAACYELERSVKELGLRGPETGTPFTRRSFPTTPASIRCTKWPTGWAYRCCFHSGFAGAGSGTPGGSGLKLKYSKPVPCFDDVGRRLPQHDHHHGAPRVAVDRRADRRRAAQVQRVSGPVGLDAPVHPGDADPRDQHAATGQGDVRLRLPRSSSRTTGWPTSRTCKCATTSSQRCCWENARRALNIAA